VGWVTLAAYDVTRRETFENLSEIWLREVDMYSTVQDAVWMIVGNKIDRNAERAVSRAEGVSACCSVEETKGHSRGRQSQEMFVFTHRWRWRGRTAACS
jgi:GTPase SAR1 family protein